MRIVDAEAIHRLLDFPSLIAALREMFHDGAEVPPRHHHAIDPLAPGPDGSPGTLLLMPAWRTGEALGVKIVTVFPDNAGARFPPSTAPICCSTPRPACPKPCSTAPR